MATTRILVVSVMGMALCGAGCGGRIGPSAQTGSAPSALVCDPNTVPFGGGSGSDAEPFRLCSTTHWRNMVSAATAGQAYQLHSDIDFAGKAPLYTDDFPATLDGDQHALRNFSGSGLFGQLSGTFRNVHLENFVVVGGTNSGAVAQTISASGVVENVVLSGTVDASFNAGAVAGVNNGVLRDIDAEVDVHGTQPIGGLVGIQNGQMERCFSRGSISGTLSIGGLAGTLAFTGRIDQSIAGPSTVSGGDLVGGLVGDSDTDTVIADAIAEVNVSGNTNVGGVIGSLKGTLTRALAAGSLSADTGPVDGICGESSGVASASYFDQTRSGFTTSHCGQGKTTVELYTTATYVGWDMATVWLSSPTAYPSLR